MARGDNRYDWDIAEIYNRSMVSNLGPCLESCWAGVNQPGYEALMHEINWDGARSNQGYLIHVGWLNPHFSCPTGPAPHSWCSLDLRHCVSNFPAVTCHLQCTRPGKDGAPVSREESFGVARVDGRWGWCSWLDFFSWWVWRFCILVKHCQTWTFGRGTPWLELETWVKENSTFWRCAHLRSWFTQFWKLSKSWQVLDTHTLASGNSR